MQEFCITRVTDTSGKFRSQRSSFSVTCGTWNFTNFPQRPSVGLWVRTCSGLCYALHGILLHHGRAMGSRTLDASTERRNHCGRLKKYHESCGIVGDGLGWPQLQQPDGVSAEEMVGARRRSRQTFMSPFLSSGTNAID